MVGDTVSCCFVIGSATGILKDASLINGKLRCSSATSLLQYWGSHSEFRQNKFVGHYGEDWSPPVRSALSKPLMCPLILALKLCHFRCESAQLTVKLVIAF